MKKTITTLLLVILVAVSVTAKITYSRQLEEKAYLGDDQAMYELSLCYRNGYGVQRDLDKANYWLERAASLGNSQASTQLDMIKIKDDIRIDETKRHELAEVEKKENQRLLKEKAKEEEKIIEEKRKLEESMKPLNNQIFKVGKVSFIMVGIKGGTFVMGAASDDVQAFSSERPTHEVSISSFWIGQTEVTQELWQEVMGENPSKEKGSKRPVENISWYDCQEFIKRLNEKTGKTFRLPTEAEWEYAARGGDMSKGYKYAGSNNPNDVSWNWDNSGRKHHKVATKSPNELGVYDMSGNVWEWCNDWYDAKYYEYSPQINPQGPACGEVVVIRGGGWHGDLNSMRVSSRYLSGKEDGNSISCGLRLALSF